MAFALHEIRLGCFLSRLERKAALTGKEDIVPAAGARAPLHCSLGMRDKESDRTGLHDAPHSPAVCRMQTASYLEHSEDRGFHTTQKEIRQDCDAAKDVAMHERKSRGPGMPPA
jgi:hypothetical protein